MNEQCVAHAFGGMLQIIAVHARSSEVRNCRHVSARLEKRLSAVPTVSKTCIEASWQGCLQCSTACVHLELKMLMAHQMALYSIILLFWHAVLHAWI
jgi:hypothetical protein